MSKCDFNKVSMLLKSHLSKYSKKKNSYAAFYAVFRKS